VLFIVSLCVEEHACGTYEFIVTCLIYCVTSHSFFHRLCFCVTLRICGCVWCAKFVVCCYQGF
jgi:hypothetical protein